MAETMIGGFRVIGAEIDPQSRCSHWHSPLDIVAIKFKCCGEFYSCYDCHRELAGHPAARWPAAEFDELAILCGASGTVMSIHVYRGLKSHACPSCGSPFNPGCAKHDHLYFDADVSL